MAVNNVTIDYNRLEVFHPAHIWPKEMDVYFEAYPVADLMYRLYLTGSLDGAATMKSYADELNNRNYTPQEAKMISTLTWEVPVKFLPLSGTVNGSGVQIITNTPTQNRTKAREALNRKYTPVAVPWDEWAASQASGTAGDRAKAGISLLNAYAGDALQTQLEEIESQLLGTGTSAENQIISLAAGIGTSAADTTTYMNISRSSITAWRGNFDAVTDADWIDETSADFCWNVMGKHEDTVTGNGAMRDNLVWIMGSTKYQYYRQSLQGVFDSAVGTSGRFNIENGKGLPGVGMYHHNVPIIYSPTATSSTAYLLDLGSTCMTGLKGAIFNLGKWTISENATQEWNRLATVSNVFVNNPRRNVYIAAA